MEPSQLQPADFHAYPPAAQAFAQQQLSLLRQMPIALAALVLREIINFDWKFPAERHELEAQFQTLSRLSDAQVATLASPFASLNLPAELHRVDWINSPAQFSEQLTAHLWATSQIEQFRRASVEYVDHLNQNQSVTELPVPRLVIVALGAGVMANTYPLFRKLKAHGTHYRNVDTTGGADAAHKVLLNRVHEYPEPYAHWLIHGSVGPPGLASATTLDYASLQHARALLITKMRSAMAPGGPGPEALRTMMAAMSPGDLQLRSDGAEGLLNRFRIAILTEGSGTQLFSTTFVQWAAREVLRRAQPATLVLHYAPRQREQSMQQMLAGEAHQVELDPQGSLIDADMGAYYTWLNARRLSGSTATHFVAYFEGGREAFAIGPGIAAGKADVEPRRLSELLIT